MPSSSHPRMLQCLLLAFILRLVSALERIKVPECPVTTTAPPCLPMLQQRRGDYERCRTQTCFLFLHEPPFIQFDVNAFNDSFQRPFPCSRPHLLHPSLRGIAFEWHNLTSTRDSLCIWAGPSASCTFNHLVAFSHFYENDYSFAITGLLLHTPERLCYHDAGASIIDDSMVIVGRTTDEYSNQSAQLFRPFNPAAWVTVFAAVFAMVLVAFCIAFYSRGKASLVTAVFVLAGESANALRVDRRLADPRDERAIQEEQKFLTRYSLAITMFRLGLLVFAGVFSLFYEVAVVNFLFQQTSVRLGKSVTTLSYDELANYSVLKDSALESVWASSVSADRRFGSRPRPWQRCDTATQCMKWLANDSHPVQFVVTFSVSGRYLIQKVSSCSELSIFQTNDILYQFNSGWLYNNKKVGLPAPQQIDREIVGLRINGSTARLIEDELGSVSCEQQEQTQIGASLIAVPVAFFVLPPLLLSFLVTFVPVSLFRKWIKKRQRSSRNGHTVSTDEFSSYPLDSNDASRNTGSPSNTDYLLDQRATVTQTSANAPANAPVNAPVNAPPFTSVPHFSNSQTQSTQVVLSPRGASCDYNQSQR